MRRNVPSAEDIQAALIHEAARRNYSSLQTTSTAPASFTAIQNNLLRAQLQLELLQASTVGGQNAYPTQLIPSGRQNVAFTQDLPQQDDKTNLPRMFLGGPLQYTWPERQLAPMTHAPVMDNMAGFQALIQRHEQEKLFLMRHQAQQALSASGFAGKSKVGSPPKRPALPASILASFGTHPQESVSLPYSSNVQVFQRSKTRAIKSFPVKLMEILMENANADILAWMPDGKSFFVVNQDDFVERIYKREFKGTRYSSFVRKLQRWGFVRRYNGTDCFSHPLFQHGRIDLAAQIEALPRNDGGSRKKKADPDTHRPEDAAEE